MVQKLYHGSVRIIETPVFGQGKPYNDYGLGFYCTDSLEMAKEWGVGPRQDGYANCYELDCEGLRILNLNTPEYGILHWLAVLLENREFDVPSSLALEAKEYLRANFSVDYSQCDAMIGYRADDSYFSFAQDFINGAISYRQLNNAMHLGRLGQQFVLKSRLHLTDFSILGGRRRLVRNGMRKRCCVTRQPGGNTLMWSGTAASGEICTSHRFWTRR